MARDSNLPEQLTTFIGREREMSEVGRLFDSARLLTLTGAAGCGKTRLALEFAARMRDRGRFEGGVWLAELASLGDPAQVPQAVAAVLDIREEAGVALDATVAAHLSGRDTLLILDNCEHLVQACAALVAYLLRNVSGLRVLATSRQPLGVSGEVDWNVPSLSVPVASAHESITPAQLASYEALQLFVDRARLKKHSFEITPQNAAAVARLCIRLDGIPLAIELAAARMKVLPLEQIVARLNERFSLLTGGGSGLLPRHQTLRATMDWSYDLLSEAEQGLLRGLSVFAGGFTLGAVDAVFGGGVGGEYAIIDLLSRLVDRSLVVVEEHGPDARYRMLETIREYALQKLEASGEAQHLHARYLEWCVRLAQESQAALLSEMQPAALARLDEEHDNLQAALALCKANDHYTEAGLKLAGALAWFWYFRGYVSEAHGWLEGMLARPDASQYPSAYMMAAGASGIMSYLQSDYPAARKRLEQSADLAVQMGDRAARAFSLAFLGRIVSYQGDASGRRVVEEAVGIFRDIGHDWGLALALDFLGSLPGMPGQEKPQRELSDLHRESLELFSRIGDQWGVALELSNFGRHAMQEGNLATAREQLEQALAIQQRVGDKWSVAWLLNNLGDVAQSEGNHYEAISSYESSLALFRELGDAAGTASALSMLGVMRARVGKQDEARALLRESLVLYDRLVDVHGQSAVLSRLAILAAATDQEEARSLATQSLKVALFGSGASSLADALAAHAELAARAGLHDRVAAILGAVDALQSTSQVWVAPYERERRQRLADEAKGRLGEEAFRRHWTHGHETAAGGSSEAVRALADFDGPLGAPPPAPARFLHPEPDELTEREMDVLRLVADGFTDGQIAERLVISTRTVQAHLRSIYSKLGVSTRTAATRHALDHHLV